MADSRDVGLPLNGLTDEARKNTVSEASQQSQTASDFIDSQLQLEADAREALPYKFEHCTQPLGPLRQNLFSCLTCNPPPASPSDPFTPAAVCYSCSIACHGEHTLVELFNRRNFTCDCGTTRLPSTSPCTLRIDPTTGMKGPVHSQAPAEENTYNQNSQNRFCGCGEFYDAQEEKGTMFQCIGLASEKEGGCGEDWWHPECVVGLGRNWARAQAEDKKDRSVDSIGADDADADSPLPPGFPDEDSFDTFICYKCVEVNPWIKQYAGTAGFLPPVYPSESERTAKVFSEQEGKGEGQRRLAEYNAAQAEATEEPKEAEPTSNETNGTSGTEDHVPKQEPSLEPVANGDTNNKKRKADDDAFDSSELSNSKKNKNIPRYHDCLPEPPTGSFSMFLKEKFREHICRCPSCYPILSKYPQLLEEEESYEPPVSESGEEGGQSVGTGSLLDRGEAALSNVDRVRAIGMCSSPMTCKCCGGVRMIWSQANRERSVWQRVSWSIIISRTRLRVFYNPSPKAGKLWAQKTSKHISKS